MAQISHIRQLKSASDMRSAIINQALTYMPGMCIIQGQQQGLLPLSLIKEQGLIVKGRSPVLGSSLPATSY